jgi:hypothetical protein
MSSVRFVVPSHALRVLVLPLPVVRRAVLLPVPLRVRVVPVRDDGVRLRPGSDVLRVFVFARLRVPLPVVLLAPVRERDVLFFPFGRVVPPVRDAVVVRRVVVFFLPLVLFVCLPVCCAAVLEPLAGSVSACSLRFSFSMIHLP